ncbi:MAG: enoyl-CoA hydratase-related protein [Gammaproteobacteria bacterium]|nr:enoyl-CoA hydratase-related protein [Gammaproteobacteria bacterium]
MSPLLTHHTAGVTSLILNRPDKRNAFDETLIEALTTALRQAIQDDATQVIVLKAQGKHFSSGADLSWMQRMSQASFEDNLQDAKQLATLLHELYHCPKPTIAQVQGATYGGGLGLIAACDIGIAEHNATFCFSEVKLGLIPATISPFIIEAIGVKAAKWLFMSAESFNAERARSLQLIQHCVAIDELDAFTARYALNLTQLPQQAVKACKSLVQQVSQHPINSTLLELTARLIAEQRQTAEAKSLIRAFLKDGHR